MGWKVPLFGDGSLVWSDTPVEPSRPVDPVATEAAFPGALELAEQVARDWSDNQYRHDRGTIDITTGQLVAAGHTPERARQIAVTSVRRLHGDRVPYTQRS